MMKSTSRRRSSRAGLTLVELIVAFSLLLILSTMALPLMQTRVQREKERRLRAALEEIRTAIDRYKDAADAGMLGQIDPDTHGYPESLEILVEGVEIQKGAMGMMGGMGGGLPGGAMGPGGNPGRGGRSGMNSGLGGRSEIGGQSAFGGRGGMGARSSGFSLGNRSGSGSSRSRSSRGGRSSGGGFGVDGGFGSEEDEEKKLRFLRRIPVDPMTGRAEWGMRSVSDSPDSMSWGGGNVFDVFSLSMDTGLDGTRYNEW